MKKVLIYFISISLGTLLGILCFCTIKLYFPTKPINKVDYITYKETIENINDIEVKYGTDINENYSYEMFINNAFKNLDLNRILYNSVECSMANCISKLNSFELNTKYLKQEIEKIYGPDITYPFKDFKYNAGDKKGVCTYKKDIYSCTLTHIDEEETLEFNYYIKKMNYIDNKIEAVSYVYYLEHGCGEEYEDVCLYKDPFKKELITKCKYNEINDYRKHFKSVNIEFTKASNNKYYLTSLNW